MDTTEHVILYGDGTPIPGTDWEDDDRSWSYQAEVVLPDGQKAVVEHYGYGVTIRQTRRVVIPKGWGCKERYGNLYLTSD